MGHCFTLGSLWWGGVPEVCHPLNETCPLLSAQSQKAHNPSVIQGVTRSDPLTLEPLISPVKYSSQGAVFGRSFVTRGAIMFNSSSDTDPFILSNGNRRKKAPRVLSFPWMCVLALAATGSSCCRDVQNGCWTVNQTHLDSLSSLCDGKFCPGSKAPSGRC